MPHGPQGNRIYPVVGNEPRKAPDYDRVVRRLSLRELAHELEVSAGSVDYRVAVAAEVDRRRGL